jgi:hypothetical protein
MNAALIPSLHETPNASAPAYGSGARTWRRCSPSRSRSPPDRRQPPRHSSAACPPAPIHEGIFHPFKDFIVIETERPGHEAGTRLYPVGEAARLTDYLREFVDRGIKRGKIPFRRVDGVRMVTLADLLADNSPRQPAPPSRIKRGSVSVLIISARLVSGSIPQGLGRLSQHFPSRFAK